MIWAQSVPDSVVKCTCGARMIRRYSAKYDSTFYGCERYPACKNTMALDGDGRPTMRVDDLETKNLRAALRAKLEKWFEPGNINDQEALKLFLRSTVGYVKIRDLTKDQIKKLLAKLEV